MGSDPISMGSARKTNMEPGPTFATGGYGWTTVMTNGSACVRVPPAS